jgi:hypothetical protein
MAHERANHFIVPSYDPRDRAINERASQGREGVCHGTAELAKAEKLCLSLRPAK